MKKLTLLLLLFIGVSNTAFSQSEKELKKIEQKATELTNKLNAEIEAGDKSVALSEEQKSAIIKIHVERILDIRKLGKDAAQEDKKADNQKHYQKIMKEILSKEQLKAIKKGKQE